MLIENQLDIVTGFVNFSNKSAKSLYNQILMCKDLTHLTIGGYPGLQVIFYSLIGSNAEEPPVLSV